MHGHGNSQEIQNFLDVQTVQRKDDRTNTQQEMKGWRCFLSFLFGRRRQLDVLGVDLLSYELEQRLVVVYYFIVPMTRREWDSIILGRKSRTQFLKGWSENMKK